MMKAIGWLIGGVLVLIVALGVYLVMNSGSLIKTAVETLGPEYLGVSVRLDSAEISLTDGTGELRGLVIGNPGEFDGPHAFRMGRILLSLDPLGQSQELIVVKAIEVDAADLALIARGKDTNLQSIMKNLESDTTSEPSESTASAPEIIIDRFSFTNARASLDSDLLGTSTVDIVDILLEGIGRKSQGVTIREAVTQMMQPIVRAATEALAKEQLNVDEIKADAEERLDKELNKRLGTSLDDLKPK